MAVPARRTSKTKKRMRRGHIKLNTPNVQFDATNGEYRVSHRVSPKGFYKGEQVVTPKANDQSQLRGSFGKLFFYVLLWFLKLDDDIIVIKYKEADYYE